MSPDIRRAAEKRQYRLAREAAEQFDAAVIHNRVHEQVGGDHTTRSDLARLLDLTEGAYQLAEDRDDLEDGSEIFAAAESLNDLISGLVDEQIARACANVLEKGDDWSDIHDEEDITAAKHEAREWLQQHLDAAERAGVQDEVTADA